MKDENSLYWIWLSERCGIASKEFGHLITVHRDPFDLYRMDEDEIEHIDGISDRLKSALCDKALEYSYSVLRYCKSNNVDVIAYYDERYPSRLRNIEDPPVLLYVLGKMPNMNERLCVGMVGTRKMSEYGRQTAYKISYELSAANAVVVSGMALGIDGVCACGALAADGTTVAVLGCGISVVYPKEHEKLMREISKHGAVITEYAPTEPPTAKNFPRRNRIISGLCQGVLIVEGAIGSGALITARKAIDQGRDLFALPGKINESNSEGPNELIQSGAYVALCAEDIIYHYDFLYHDSIDYTGLHKAKTRMTPEANALKKYEVSALYYKGRYDRAASAQTPKDISPVPEETATPKVSAHSKDRNKQTADISDNTQNQMKASTVKEKTPSGAVLDSLDTVTKAVFESMPINNTSVSPDALVSSDIGISEVITSLTLLEIHGLVSSLPGGFYVKN